MYPPVLYFYIKYVRHARNRKISDRTHATAKSQNRTHGTAAVAVELCGPAVAVEPLTIPILNGLFFGKNDRKCRRGKNEFSK